MRVDAEDWRRRGGTCYRLESRHVRVHKRLLRDDGSGAVRECVAQHLALAFLRQVEEEVNLAGVQLFLQVSDRLQHEAVPAGSGMDRCIR